ncbi:MAG: DUF5606 domain-containing protein [Bacteroidales bacterium]
MDLSLIFAIPGKPGLYKLISRSKTNALVESLIDKKRLPVFSLDKVSSLEEIAIYTYEEEYPLIKLFRDIFNKEEGKVCISPTEPEAKLKEYFLEILPNYDQERVYISNIKKVYQWYNLLLANAMLDTELSPREKALEEAENKEAAATEDSEKQN